MLDHKDRVINKIEMPSRAYNPVREIDAAQIPSKIFFITIVVTAIVKYIIGNEIVKQGDVNLRG